MENIPNKNLFQTTNIQYVTKSIGISIQPTELW